MEKEESLALPSYVQLSSDELSLLIVAVRYIAENTPRSPMRLVQDALPESMEYARECLLRAASKLVRGGKESFSLTDEELIAIRTAISMLLEELPPIVAEAIISRWNPGATYDTGRSLLRRCVGEFGKKALVIEMPRRT